MSLELRPYQEKALEEIKNHYRAGVRRVMLHLATGGGKTLIFCTALKGAAVRGTSCLVAVRGVKLIQQACDRLEREGVEHGVIQGANTRNQHLPVRVCSIDTLYARQHAPDADFLVIDEAHQTGSDGYKWFLSQYPKARILAVSATPHLDGGLRHIADEIVYPISVKELIDQGYLVKPRYFSVFEPNLKDVKVSKGEFNEKQLGEVMTKAAVTGDPVGHYRKYADGRPALMFAVNVAHSKTLVKLFTDAGIAAEHIDAKSSQQHRNEAIARLESGEIKVLSNVGVLTTGFDCPPVSCLIVCRPTMSYNLHIQIIGRGTRLFPGKENFIVLDHSGNCKRHGLIEMEQEASLDPKKKEKEKAKTKECKGCMALIPRFAPVCPLCGLESAPLNDEEKERNTEHVDGELQEINDTQELWELDLDRFTFIAKERGIKKGWIFFKMKEKYGDQIAALSWNKVRVMKAWPVKGKKNEF